MAYNKTSAILNKLKRDTTPTSSGIVNMGEPLVLPNNSGDHQKSIKRNAPVGDKDLVNKEYVDSFTSNHPHQDVTTTASPTFDGLSLNDDLDITTGHIHLDDNYALKLGTGDDILIYYTGSAMVFNTPSMFSLRAGADGEMTIDTTATLTTIYGGSSAGDDIIIRANRNETYGHIQINGGSWTRLAPASFVIFNENGTDWAYMSKTLGLSPTNNQDTDIGSSSKNWRKLYCKDGYFSNSLGIGTSTPGTINGVAYGGTHTHTKGVLGRVTSEGTVRGQLILVDSGASTNEKVLVCDSESGNFKIFRINDNGSSGNELFKINSDNEIILGARTLGSTPVDYTKFDSDGVQTMHGDARVTKVKWLGANAIKGWFTDAASFVESGLTGVWEFSNNQSEKVSGTFKIPNDMDRSEVAVFHIGWSADGSSPGDCEWQLEYLWISPDDDTTAAAQETLTVTATASSTSNGFVFTSFSGIDLPSSTDKAMLWRLTRLASGGNDTINDSVELRGCALSYTANKLGTAL